MRDHKRIPRILEKLGKVWEKNPDWRLCQLLFNTTQQYDSFYYDDDTLEKNFDCLLKEDTEECQ